MNVDELKKDLLERISGLEDENLLNQIRDSIINQSGVDQKPVTKCTCIEESRKWSKEHNLL